MYVRRWLVALVAAIAFAAGGVVAAPSPAQAAPAANTDIRWVEQHWFFGTIVHLSNNGTRRMGENGQDMSWLLSFYPAGAFGFGAYNSWLVSLADRGRCYAVTTGGWGWDENC